MRTYRGYTIAKNTNGNYEIRNPSGMRWDEIAVNFKTAKKWIDADILERSDMMKIRIEEYNRKYLFNAIAATNGIEDADDQIRFTEGYFQRILPYLPISVLDDIINSFFPEIEESVNQCLFCGRYFTPGEDGNELGFCAPCVESREFPFDIDAYYQDYGDGKVAFKGTETLGRGLLEPYRREKVVRIRCINKNSEGEILFWSNEDGWVYRDSATLFKPEDIRTFNPPIEGEWVNGYDKKI